MFKNIKYDFPAGVVVFLVAVPLCLGIAFSSDAPLFSGIIAGIIGGLVVPMISRSQLSVSGPAAGLTAVVIAEIAALGSFEAFLVAVFFAGCIQILLGLIKAGFIAYYFPSSVIKGMLAAIGVILILKQLPHAIGYDHELFGLAFTSNEEENTFTLLLHAFKQIEWGALIISALSIGIFILWQKTALKNIHWVPAALVVVVLGTLINIIYQSLFPHLTLGQEHLVELPLVLSPFEAKSFSEFWAGFLQGFASPDWSILSNPKIWGAAVSIGLIASIETLLTIEAVDKIDPYKRKSPLNRELFAQGIGNMTSGLIGGLPVTSVIVRSSANINAGGRTKKAAFIHGILLLLSVIFISKYMRMVPLSALASILLMVGFKLAHPKVFKSILRKGWEQFVPFLITIVAILFTDLLIGVGVGTLIGICFVIYTNFHSAISLKQKDGVHYITLNKDVSFLNKAKLTESLEAIPDGEKLIIDGTKAQFIDNDILELIQEFHQESQHKNIEVSYKNMDTMTIFKRNTFQNKPIHNSTSEES